MGVSTISTTASMVYANPSYTKTYITSIDVHNTQSSQRVISIFLVPNNGEVLGIPLSTNQIYKFTIPAFDTVLLESPFPYILDNTNDAIFAESDGTGVNILCKGSKYV